MAPGVTVHRNPATVYGTDEWAEENLRWTRNTLRSAEADCIPVAVNMPHYRAWCDRHGLAWEAFCKEKLEADPNWITKIEEGVAILKGRGHAGPATQEQAAAVVAELAAQTMPAANPGGKRDGAGRPEGRPNGLEKESNGDSKNQAGVANLISKGTTASYLTRRIARDAPEILEQMKQGAFKSVRAAARAAGIIRDKTRIERALAIVQRMTDEELLEFEAHFDMFLQHKRAV